MEIIAAMRDVAEDYPERVLIGEIYLPIPRLVAYYGEGGNGVHLPFNFHLLDAKWDAAALAQLIADYEGALPAGGWPNWVLGNHDKPRIASRVGAAQARVAAMLLLTLRGTPTMYYGDEIGMRDVPIPFDEVRDPFELNEPHKGLGRDPQRTPMRWFPRSGAGFTRSTPWLRIGDDVDTCNVATQADDPRSMLSLYKALLRLRRDTPALHGGDVTVLAASDAVLAYERRSAGDRRIVVLNLTDAPAALPLPEPTGVVLLSTHGDEVRGELRPNEARIYRAS